MDVEHAAAGQGRDRSCEQAKRGLHPRRRPGMGRYGCLQLPLRGADAALQWLCEAGHALSRHARLERGVHAQPLQHPYRTLSLAVAAEERRARRRFAKPDRAGADDGAVDAERGGLLHGGSGQVAPGPGRCGQDRLHHAVNAGTELARLRLLLRHSRVARHGAVSLLRE